jgi:hypothetical protein
MAACGGGRVAARPLSAAESIQLRVTNINWADINVYAVRGLTRSRIGFVTSLTTRSFRVPGSSMPDGTLRLLIDPVGSEKTYVTEAIVAASGQRVELTVMPTMTMSTFAVRAW